MKKKVVDNCSNFEQRTTRASSKEDSCEQQQGRFSALQLETGLLGQHGGELLLESPFSTLTPNMLGIIVKGTKVSHLIWIDISVAVFNFSPCGICSH